MSATHLYRAFGLNVRSELAMPHWPAANGPADVHVHWGEVPEALPGRAELWGGAFAGGSDRCLLRYQNVGRMLVEGGTRITCAMTDGGSQRALGTALSSVGFAALLNQRGEICLHASAAEKDGRAYLIAGASGVGKSTIVTALLERGCRLISDDITVVRLRTDGGLEAVPSFPAIRLLPDSLQVLKLRSPQNEGFHTLDDKLRQRFDEHFVSEPVPIARVCRVLTGAVNAPVAEPVLGTLRFLAWQRVVYRPNMVRLLTDPRRFDSALMMMASRAEFRRVVRPETGFPLDELCRLISG